MIEADGVEDVPMPALAGTQLLALWERADGRHPIDGAVDTIAAAFPDCDVESIRLLPLGERDIALLRVRRATIGDRLEARAACPTCGAEVELALSCTDLLAGHESPPTSWPLAEEGYRLVLRPLDSLDAAEAARAADADAARSVLLARAVVEATRGQRAIDVADLPGPVVDAISRSLGERDSAADLVLEFRCPDCGANWGDSLDVASFVTAELSAGGRRMLGEIDLLARAYGWPELDILALGDARRAAYVALVMG